MNKFRNRICVSKFWIKLIPFINAIRKIDFLKLFGRFGRDFNFSACTNLKR